MPDWSAATGMQLEMVQDALLSAFPVPQNFETFLQFRLNKFYPLLAPLHVTYQVGLAQVLLEARAANWLDELITAAQTKVPGNPKLKALRHLGDLTSTPTPPGKSLEDIVRNDGGFADIIPWIKRLDGLRAQMCRIECPVGQGVGTGWLVASDLLMTNGHVITRILSNARKPADYAFRFDYATDANGTNPGTTYRLANDWCLRSSPPSPLELGTGAAGPTGTELDYALLRLEQPVGTTMGPSGQQRGWVTIKQGTAVPAIGSIVLVLQHPSGSPLKLAIGAVAGPNGNGTRVAHSANTEGGSSGSPCFDAKLELFALHNSGDPLYDGVHGAAHQNHAVPIEAILATMYGTPVPKFWA
ncbi:MAG: trypsin-like peptidase domain-containing protein [Planctomycetota bacterium]